MYHRGEAGPTRPAGLRRSALTGLPDMTAARANRIRPLIARGRAIPMLDLGTSFLASVARDPDALAIVDGDLRLTYRAWYEQDFGARRRLRRARAAPGRPSRHAAAEPLGGGDDPLGLPVRRHHRHAAELALDRRRTRFLPRRRRGEGDRLRRGLRRGGGVRRAAQAPARASPWATPRRARSAFDAHLATTRTTLSQPRVDAEAWSVMLYTSGTTARPEGRAAPPARRARRGARACRAESLRPAASARSASCRSITPWACARCSPCR